MLRGDGVEAGAVDESFRAVAWTAPFPGRRWPAAVLASIKYRRRGLGADDATGGPWYYRLLRRAADVVAGPRPRERAGRGLQGVLGPVKYRKRGVTVAVDRVDGRVD